MSISIQPLSDFDLDVADAILKAAFQRSDNWVPDLQICRNLQPDGYFLAYQNGEPVGMVGAIIYSNYAYVGLMAVKPINQRQGVGLSLMEHLLSWLERRQVLLTLLDASPQGQLLYEKLGFLAYDQVVVLQQRNNQPTRLPPGSIRTLSIPDLDLLAASDTQAFGTDRSRVLRTLLEAYAGRAFGLQDEDGQIAGHIFAQEKRLGPWVMQETTAAEGLLQAALSVPFGGPVSVAVPAGNVVALGLLERYGFERVRVNRHMARGPGAMAGQRDKVLAQTSLFLG